MHVAEEPLEQVEQRLVGPVEVFEQDDRRALARQLAEEVHPCLVQAVARRERMQVAGDVEAEREAEDRILTGRSPEG
jgi:hypothetical protein